MSVIIVTSTPMLWEESQKEGFYRHSTINSKLSEVGFIHATKPSQVTNMLNRNFRDRDDILLLVIDPDKIEAQVKYEKSLSGTPGEFPHIYGPLNIDAVLKTIKPTKDDSGHFTPNNMV